MEVRLMKKSILLMLTFVLAISLVACGGGNDNGGGSTTTPSANNDTTNPPSNNGNNATGDLTTIEGFLTAFGLTENDLKCANYNRLDITSHVIDTGVIKEVGAYVSKKLTDEEVKAWLDQIIAKLNSLSDDGKVERLLGDGEALTTDYIMSQTMYMGSGYYTYNGKEVSVRISVMPGYLDNTDPNNAMAACTLNLEAR
jgi:hypothetical protein